MLRLNELQLAKELIRFPSVTPVDAGVMSFLEKKLRRSDMWQREELNKYLSKFDCEVCNGNRLKKEAGLTIC